MMYQKRIPFATMEGRIAVCMVFFLNLLIFQLHAQEIPAVDDADWGPGRVFYDENNRTEVIAGDIPLIISVPHGGQFHDESIPDRNCSELGRLVRGVDSRTIETAKAIDSVFQARFNQRPYFIISHLSRRKVDQNRDVELASCGHEQGIQAWNFYHQSIDSAIAHASKRFDRLVFIDLHGHGHKNPRLELGYALTKDALKDAYRGKKLKSLARQSSLQNILKGRKVKARFREMLFGPASFGTLIYNQGIPATPSMQDPHPVGDEGFWSGGYNTRRYTSVAYPNVYGFQIEAHFRGARDNTESRSGFATAFAEAYQQFIETR